MVSWSLETIAGQTADVWRPTSTVDRVVVFLHGYDSRTPQSDAAWSAEISRRNWAVVAPHGPGCWWGDSIYQPFCQDISPLSWLHEHLSPWIDNEWPGREGPVGLVGYEMGGQGVLQLAYQWPREYPVVAAIAPKVDVETWHGHGLTLDQIYSTAEAARQASPLLRLRGLQRPRAQLIACDPDDPYCFRGSQLLTEKLASSGFPHETEFTLRTGGFGWDFVRSVAGRVTEWLDRELQREALRLDLAEESSGPQSCRS